MKAKAIYELVWMSRPLMQAAEACVKKGLTGTDLTVQMRAVLEILSVHGDLTVPEIAAKLEIKRQYVQLMVNDTLASGLTTQCPNPRHKRSPLLTLTDRRRETIDGIVSWEMDLMQDIGSDVREEQLLTALKLVHEITAKLKSKAGEQKW